MRVHAGDLAPDLVLWTPHLQSWFPLRRYRWPLTPYRQTVYGTPGEAGEVTFRLYNALAEEQRVELSLEFPTQPWEVELAGRSVGVPPGQVVEVPVRYTVPAEGEERVCHLRATPPAEPEFTTYSTLRVRGGEAPAGRPLAMPLTLRPYEHENEQFGYLPHYPLENQVYFDPQNRPYVVTGHGLATEREGGWLTMELSEAVVECVPPLQPGAVRVVLPKIGFGAHGEVYLVGRVGERYALLHSRDGGRSFRAYAMPAGEGGSASFDLEVFSGHNLREGPPPLVGLTRVEAPATPGLRWRSVNTVELIVPRKEGELLTMAEPVRLSSSGLDISMHSGAPSCVVSRGSRVHVAWGEATDPEADVPGVPVYASTWDREAGLLGKPVLLGYGPPPNDGHNTPSITMDSRGYLHVVIGTHGRPFLYTRSLQPEDAHSGWTEPETVGDNLSQTYIGLVCAPDDSLHVVFRWWRSGVEPFPLSSFGTLAHIRRPPGGPWGEPQPLVLAPFSEYSVFYHRLTIDRRGALFVSCDYWSTFWFYRNDQRGPVAAASGRPGRGWGRAVLTSPEGGNHWRLW